MLTNLAIWYLRKKERSVLIGYELEGGLVRSLNKNAFVYDNTLTDVTYRTHNNHPLYLPEGAFKIKKR